MKIEEIRALARDIGVKPGKLNKIQLVRNIQLHEGNFDCFGRAANGHCDQHACGWREDCFAAATKKPATVKKSATKKKTATAKKSATKAKTDAKKPPAAKKKAAKKKK